MVLRGRGARRDLRARFTQLGCESERLAIEEQRFVARFISAPSFFPCPSARPTIRRERKKRKEREREPGRLFGLRPATSSRSAREITVRRWAKWQNPSSAGVRLIFGTPSRLKFFSFFFLAFGHTWHFRDTCRDSSLDPPSYSCRIVHRYSGESSSRRIRD